MKKEDKKKFAYLEKEFKKNINPTNKKIYKISKTIKMNIKKIKLYFRNSKRNILKNDFKNNFENIIINKEIHNDENIDQDLINVTIDLIKLYNNDKIICYNSIFSYSNKSLFKFSLYFTGFYYS
jgi:hypothetical protein